MSKIVSHAKTASDVSRMRPRHHRAFSLVEVVLALGIVTIALFPMIGLLSVALDATGSAGDDTALAAMCAQALADLRAAPFDALGDPAPRQAATIPATLPTTLADSTYYFSTEGTLISGTNAAGDPHALYECVVKKFPESDTQGEKSGSTAGPYNRVKLELFFSWPVSSNPDPAKRAGKQWYYASIARY
ncbi:MAG: hypothetical protein PHQ12_10270 [Chthoniobacteraceae bacterium]|nr:hypothetical protein [Chthoniobacteraceae bacterium]